MLCMMSRLTFFCTRGEAPLHAGKVALYMCKGTFLLTNQATIPLYALTTQHTSPSFPLCTILR